MAKQQEHISIAQQKQLARLLFVGGILIVAGALYLWYSQVYSNTERVFWAMVDNNLKSFGQTQSQSQVDQSRGLSQEQKLQLQLGAQNVVRGQAKLSQDISPEQRVSIETDSISTPAATYVRYSDIQINDQPGSSVNSALAKVQNTWAKEERISANNSAFVEALYGSLGRVPTAHLSIENRQRLTNFMKDNKVYTIDYAKVKKEKRGSRSVHVYEVMVNVEQYVRMLTLLDEMNGLKMLTGVDPAQFAGGQPIAIELSVDVLTRSLVEAGYNNGQQKESFSAPGAVVTMQLPSETISLSELQQKLQQALFRERIQ
jgi:hypothetical protein